MEDKGFLLKVKEKVDKSNKPILVEDCVDYIKAYHKLKYYYSNETVKNEHIKHMEQDIYCKFDNVCPAYDVLYTNHIDNNDIKVLVGYFYKEMNPFLLCNIKMKNEK